MNTSKFRLFFLCFLMIYTQHILGTEVVVPTFLYKLISPQDWEASQQSQYIVRSPIDTNFIHLATVEQIPHIAPKSFGKASRTTS